MKRILTCFCLVIGLSCMNTSTAQTMGSTNSDHSTMSISTSLSLGSTKGKSVDLKAEFANNQITLTGLKSSFYVQVFTGEKLNSLQPSSHVETGHRLGGNENYLTVIIAPLVKSKKRPSDAAAQLSPGMKTNTPIEVKSITRYLMTNKMVIKLDSAITANYLDYAVASGEKANTLVNDLRPGGNLAIFSFRIISTKTSNL